MTKDRRSSWQRGSFPWFFFVIVLFCFPNGSGKQQIVIRSRTAVPRGSLWVGVVLEKLYHVTKPLPELRRAAPLGKHVQRVGTRDALLADVRQQVRGVRSLAQDDFRVIRVKVNLGRRAEAEGMLWTVSAKEIQWPNCQCFICRSCTIRDLPVRFGCQRAWLRRDQSWSTAEVMEKSLDVAGSHSWRLHPTKRNFF